jgi:hypothetical protein
MWAYQNPVQEIWAHEQDHTSDRDQQLSKNLTVGLCLPCWVKEAFHAYLEETEKSTSDSPMSEIGQRTVGEEFWNVKAGGMACYGYPILQWVMGR